VQLDQDFSNLGDRRVLVLIIRYRFPERDRMSIENDRLVNVEDADGRIVD
jgi:hypothetical protein